MFRLPAIGDNCRMCNQIIVNSSYHVPVECQVCRDEKNLFIFKNDEEEVVRGAYLDILIKTDFEQARKLDKFIRKLLERM